MIRALVALVAALTCPTPVAQSIEQALAHWQSIPRYLPGDQSESRQQAAGAVLFESCPEGYDTPDCVHKLRAADYTSLLPDNPDYWRAYEAVLSAEMPGMTAIDLYRMLAGPENVTHGTQFEGFLEATRQYGHRLRFAELPERTDRALSFSARHRRLLGRARTLMELIVFLATTQQADLAVVVLQAAAVAEGRYEEAARLAAALAPLDREQLRFGNLIEPTIDYLHLVSNRSGALFCAVAGGPVVDRTDRDAVRMAFAGSSVYPPDVVEEGEQSIRRLFRMFLEPYGTPWVDKPRTSGPATIHEPQRSAGSFESYRSFAEGVHRLLIAQSLNAAMVAQQLNRLPPGVPTELAPPGFSWAWRSDSRQLCLVPSEDYFNSPPGTFCVHRYL